MSQSIFTILLFALTSLPLNLLNDEGQEAETPLTPEYVMNKMFVSVQNLDYAQFNMITSERVDGELLLDYIQTPQLQVIYKNKIKLSIYLNLLLLNSILRKWKLRMNYTVKKFCLELRV